MALKNITDLKKRLDTLEKLQLFGATKMDQSSVATFKMEKYQSHMDSMKRLHREFFSPPFYTSPGGHKMKVSYSGCHRKFPLNRVGSSKRKHQTWSFQAKIKVQILNQESHLSTLILYGAEKDSMDEVDC